MAYHQILPTDPKLNWGHVKLGILTQLWQQRSITGKGVRIGVLDSGLIPDHPDISLYPKSQTDLTGAAPSGTTSHGAYCCGLVGAAGSQVFGVAPEAGLAYGRVKLNARSIAEGIEWLLTVRPAVHAISISLEIFEENEPPADMQRLRDALRLAEEKGKVVVAAIGNDFDHNDEMIPRWPAVGDTVLAVGAVKENMTIHEESGMHSCVDLVAPGHRLLTAEQGGGTFPAFERTSAAAAFATGALALVLQVLRDQQLERTPQQIRDLLKQTASYPFAHGTKCQSNLYGCGLINPVEAVKSLLKGV